jgi:hypothetical protein
MKIICCLLSFLYFANAIAQKSYLDSIISKHKYTIELTQNGLSGDGIQFLLSEVKDAQFVLIGENHNTKEIPEFTSLLFEQLNKLYQFEYLALEQDPAMMKIISDRTTNISDLARKYHNGFTFITDQELAMMQKVRSISKAKNPIWGCDQSFGASHSIDVINSFLKSKRKQVTTIDSLCTIIYEKEKARNIESYHYMSELNKTQELQLIKDNIPFKYTNSLNFYIDELLTSDSIYKLIRNKMYFESRAFREDYLKKRFLSEYKLATTKNKTPKVVLKFGNNHLNNGYNPGSSVNSLGNFVRQLALINNKSSISINALIYRNDGSDWDYFTSEPALLYLQHFADNTTVTQWTLFDLRPLKAAYYNETLAPYITKEEQRNWENLIYGYDFLLLIGNGTDGDATITNGQY